MKSRLRIAHHQIPNDMTDSEFRLNLQKEYKSKVKRIERIETRDWHFEHLLSRLDRKRDLQEIKRDLLLHIRQVEPDALTPDNGIDPETVVWTLSVVQRWFEDKIHELETQ